MQGGERPDGRSSSALGPGHRARPQSPRLARASRVEIANGTTRLDNVALDVGGGNVAVVSGTAGSTLNLNATLTSVPASVVNNFAPGLDAAGTISGTARVTGAAANPSVNYSLDWRGAQTSQTRGAGLGGINVTSTGDFAGGNLRFQANALGRLRHGDARRRVGQHQHAFALARFLHGGAPFASPVRASRRRACR